MNGRRFAVIAIASLTLAAGSTVSAAAAPTDYGSAITAGQSAMQAAVDSGASSVMAALITPDKIVWTGSAGAVDAAGTKPTTTTRYTIGSLSKLPTAIAVMQMVDKGLIDLDAPVITYLPELTMTSPDYRAITVRMLLNHSAGFPGTDYTNAFTTAPHDGYAEQVLASLAKQPLKTTPGAMSVYSNDGFTLLQLILQKVTGQPFTDVMNANLFAPLGMTHSSYWTQGVAADPAIAPMLGTDRQPLPLEVTNVLASGGLVSTTTDMAQVARMLLGDGTVDGTRILSPAAVAAMGTDQIPGSLSVGSANPWEFGLGWDTVQQLGFAQVGQTAWVKGGDTSDYHSGMVVLPEAGLAAVVVGNGPVFSSDAAELIAEDMLMNALVDQGTIDAMPTAALVAPKSVAPTQWQRAAASGTFLNYAFALRARVDADGALHVATVSNGQWVESPRVLTMRKDGWFWAEGTGLSVRAEQTWGRTYLVQRGPSGVNGTYAKDTIAGQKVYSAPTPKAWQGRTGHTWLNVSERADSTMWGISPTITLQSIPGLTGYLVAAYAPAPATINVSRSDNVGFMPIQLPFLFGRDLYEISVRNVDGQEWLQSVNYTARPKDSVPALATGTTTVTIGADGYAQWFAPPSGASIAVQGSQAWRIYDKDVELLQLSTGTGPVTNPASAYLLVHGAPGASVTITIGS